MLHVKGFYIRLGNAELMLIFQSEIKWVLVWYDGILLCQILFEKLVRKLAILHTYFVCLFFNG